MNYSEAVEEILQKAAHIKLPNHRSDVVTLARRGFARKGSCDSDFIQPIEQIIRECIHCWTVAQKQGIWTSTETGMASKRKFNSCTPESIDTDLEGELKYHVIQSLSPAKDEREGLAQ